MSFELEILKQIRQLRAEIERLKTVEGTGVLVDYSATSTITGWSSFTVKVIRYKVVGNLVFVFWDLRGTSDATTITFTLPYNSTLGMTLVVMIRGRDNGTYVAGTGVLTHTSNLIQGFSSISGGTWTASGTKEFQGELYYER